MKRTPLSIRRQLKQLRRLIETDPDVAVKRVAYAIEGAVRYITEDTTGWPSLVQQARDEALFLKRELKLETT